MGDAKEQGMDVKQMLNSEQLVTFEYLRSKGMPDKQAKRTLMNAFDTEAEKHKKPFHLEDAEEPLRTLGQHVRANRDDLFDIFKTTVFYDATDREPTEEAKAEAAKAEIKAKSNLEKSLASMAENSVDRFSARGQPKV